MKRWTYDEPKKRWVIVAALGVCIAMLILFFATRGSHVPDVRGYGDIDAATRVLQNAGYRVQVDGTAPETWKTNEARCSTTMPANCGGSDTPVVTGEEPLGPWVSHGTVIHLTYYPGLDA
jgi:hypothetical protein